MLSLSQRVCRINSTTQHPRTLETIDKNRGIVDTRQAFPATMPLTTRNTLGCQTHQLGLDMIHILLASMNQIPRLVSHNHGHLRLYAPIPILQVRQNSAKSFKQQLLPGRILNITKRRSVKPKCKTIQTCGHRHTNSLDSSVMVGKRSPVDVVFGVDTKKAGFVKFSPSMRMILRVIV